MIYKPTTRREFMKTLSSLAAIGLTTSLSPDLLWAQTNTDLKGVTIDYWCQVQQQNPIIKELCISIVKAFEQKTGCKVKLTMEGYGSIIGPKYRTNFSAGKRPTVFDSCARWTGALRDYLLPMNDFIEKDLDATIKQNIEWFFPLNKLQNSGSKDPDAIKDLAFMFIAQAPVVTRKDLWQKAGIDFDSNWPIKDSDHFLEICGAFKTSKVVEFPTEVYGKLFDAADTQLNGWIRSLDKEKSHFISKDWSTSNADAECWIKGVQFYVDLFRKYNYSSPASPQSTDEASVEQLILGKKAMVHCDLLNRGTFLARMPKEMADGVVQWGPHFPLTGGNSGSVAFLPGFAQCIVKQEGPDAKIKEQAAWAFIKEWFTEENQIALAKSAGMCTRKDLWPQLQGAPDNFAEATHAMMNDPGMWTNHPKGVDIQYNLCAPHIQKAMGGADVATELKAYAAEVNKVLKG